MRYGIPEIVLPRRVTAGRLIVIDDPTRGSRAHVSGSDNVPIEMGKHLTVVKTGDAYVDAETHITDTEDSEQVLSELVGGR